MGAPGADDARAVSAHYGRPGLAVAILDALRAAGKDPAALTPDDLAPVDQFHLGGRAATRELARLADPRPEQTILDVGGGLGGPARTLATEFGCRVTVADATADYCQTGALLTARTGLAGRVAFVVASALALPFRDQRFDVVWTQHSTMNVADKERLAAELRRVLRPGGRWALHEVMTGQRIPVRFPVPWASDQALSFLQPPAALRGLLAAVGFAELAWADVTDRTLAAIVAPARETIPATPTPIGLHLLLGPACEAMMRNLVRNLAEGRIAVVQAVLERR